MSEALCAEGIYKAFETPQGRLEVLHGVELSVQEGEFVSIIGVSGAGKSTLLHILGGLDHPTRGRVVLAGRDLSGLVEPSIAEVRNRLVGFVFQFHHLLPEFSALENVMLPARVARRSDRRAREEATELIRSVGLADRAQHRPGELSGGERQRVALARAMINRPKVLFLDEPTGNLDQETGLMVFEAVQALRRATGVTTVLVTHNFELADRSDRVLHLVSGRLAQAAASPDPANA